MENELRILRCLKEIGDFKEFREFCETYRTKVPLSTTEMHSVLTDFKNKGLIHAPTEHNFCISPLGLEQLQIFEDRFTKQQKLDSIQFSLKSWQKKTFWPVFIFGLIGGVFALIQMFMLSSSTQPKADEIVTKEYLEQYVDSLLHQ